MKEREFKYDDKETYTKKELDELLVQHKEFVGNNKAELETIKELNEKIALQESKYTQTVINSEVSKLVSADKLKIVLSMGKFNSTNTEDINAEVKRIYKENPILTKVETPIMKHEAPPVKQKTYRYVRPDYNKIK